MFQLGSRSVTIPVIGLLSLLSLSFVCPRLAWVNTSYAQVVVMESDSETLRLLPEKYQEKVLLNLSLSETNRAQLLLAIKTIRPDYREALGFVLANAPAMDLRQLSASSLIENIEFSYLA